MSIRTDQRVSLAALVGIGIIVSLALCSPRAESFEYKASLEPTNCRPTLEKWIKHETKEGEKILTRYDTDGAGIQEFVVVWDSGTIERVLVAPVRDKGYCITARQYVGKAPE